MITTNQFDVLIGKNVQQTRCLARLDSRELAAKIGISQEQVGRYENGIDRIKSSHLWDIAQALNVPITHFFPEHVQSQWAQKWQEDGNGLHGLPSD